MTTGEIVADLPELTPQHVQAAIEFAAVRERRLATGEAQARGDAGAALS